TMLLLVRVPMWPGNLTTGLRFLFSISRSCLVILRFPLSCCRWVRLSLTHTHKGLHYETLTPHRKSGSQLSLQWNLIFVFVCVCVCVLVDFCASSPVFSIFSPYHCVPLVEL